MTVVFDYQVFYLQKYGGISRYFYELANELDKLNGCEPRIVAPFHQNQYLKQHKNKAFILEWNPGIQKLFYNRFYDKRLTLNQWLTKKLYAGKKNIILHETYYTQRFDVHLPRVITIHDMIPELMSNGRDGEDNIIQHKRQAIEAAAHIIAVSESTKKDLLKIYPAAGSRTSVVHHGIHAVNAQAIEAYQNNKPYILFVGNRGWYKNFNLLINVYSQDQQLQEQADIICFGGGNFSEEENKLIEQYGLAQRVKYKSGNDDLLNSLYKGAAVLAYLSKYEGFGLPVLEAMMMGCPVICSNGSSLPEVACNCAQLIDVSDQQQVSAAIKKALLNHEDIIEMVAQGRQRAAQFTWKKCAEETLKIYNTLLSANA